jgi:hypothetical protein
MQAPWSGDHGAADTGGAPFVGFAGRSMAAPVVVTIDVVGGSAGRAPLAAHATNASAARGAMNLEQADACGSMMLRDQCKMAASP